MEDWCVVWDGASEVGSREPLSLHMEGWLWPDFVQDIRATEIFYPRKSQDSISISSEPAPVNHLLLSTTAAVNRIGRF